MAKSVASNRVPSQNIVTGVTPVIDAKDPLKIFLRQSSYIEKDVDVESLYAKYISSPATSYEVKEKEETVEEEDLSSLTSGSVELSSIESATSEIYYDSLGNPKVKYVLKIRNLSLDKDNVVGVDARIYNPFA